MNEELKLYLICFVRNIICLICFTVLAIIFNKWWIVLFTILFWISVERKENKENKNEQFK
ncbi:MAG: hypothetical protein IIZ67_04780 [Bacilli bacterium]|nr:hypothetical protein [Bacilli bacterium]